MICDSFIDGNSTVTLSECIEESGHIIDELCSRDGLEQHKHSNEKLSDLASAIHVLWLIYILFRYVHIFMLYFGCIKGIPSWHSSKSFCQHMNKKGRFMKLSTFEARYCWLGFMFILVLIMILIPVFSDNYINETIDIANGTDLEAFCGTADIVWRESSTNSNTWLVISVMELLIFIVITILDFLCINSGKGRQLNRAELIDTLRYKSNVYY